MAIQRATREEALALTIEGLKLRMLRTGETVVTAVMMSEVAAQIAESNIRYDNYVNFINWKQFRNQVEERLKNEQDSSN